MNPTTPREAPRPATRPMSVLAVASLVINALALPLAGFLDVQSRGFGGTAFLVVASAAVTLVALASAVVALRRTGRAAPRRGRPCAVVATVLGAVNVLGVIAITVQTVTLR